MRPVLLSFHFFSILDLSKENPWQKHTTKAWVQHGPTTKIGSVCYEVSLCLFADVCLCATLSSFRLYHSLFSHYSGTIQSVFRHYSIFSRYSIFSHYSTIIQSLVHVTAGIKIRYMCLALWCAPSSFIGLETLICRNMLILFHHFFEMWAQWLPWPSHRHQATWQDDCRLQA
jgi:hypothetical protein